MIKILLGGSPCTHWSIARAQCEGRETKAEGLGWELFKNYVIAKQKFKPDFFLYENNVSASLEIKTQIETELQVERMEINSALLSAQNRKRFYCFNWTVEQPEDKGLVIKDILDDLPENRALFEMPRAVSKKNYVQFDVSGKGHNSQQDRAFYLDGKFGCLPSARADTKVKVCERGSNKYFNLTLNEVKALQTIPKEYRIPMFNGKPNIGMLALGNGWTAEVIIHILNGALKDVPRDEEIVVLSMYDGIGTGRYCLDKMGFTNVTYYAYEIDKYSKEIALLNYPDIIQMGDAFDLRKEGWEIGCGEEFRESHQKVS